MTQLPSNATVIYHSPCPDGTTAAWAAWATLESLTQMAIQALWGEKAKLERFREEGLPIFYGTDHGRPLPPPAILEDRPVYLLDFCYGTDGLLEILKHTRQLVVLDHHPTAFDNLRGLGCLRQYVNDGHCTLELAGAQIAWDYFWGGTPRPRFVDYVADADTFRFALPDSKAINAALRVNRDTATFESLDRLHSLTDEQTFLEASAKEGRCYLTAHAELLEDIARRAFPAQCVVQGSSGPGGEFEHNVMVVNLAEWRLVSAAGDLIAERNQDADFVALWNYSHRDDRTKVSLRTVRDYLDLSKVARALGAKHDPRRICGPNNGGGHAKAAAFAFPGSNIRAVFPPRPAETPVPPSSSPR